MAMIFDKEADDCDGSAEDEGSIDPADALFERAVFLRKLREADEIERHAPEEDGADDDNDEGENHPRAVMDEGQHTLPNGQRILDYNAYLEHQRYYDDCKHIDYHYIDYGTLEGSASFSSSMAEPCSYRYPLLIEQDKSLGKGGLCWDAAFILGEFMGQTMTAAVTANATVPATVPSTIMAVPNTTQPLRMIELGAGTGICGLVVAKLLQQQSAHPLECHVTLTDLPGILPLLQRNVARNFDAATMARDDLRLSPYYCAGKQYSQVQDCVQDCTSVRVTISPLDWDNSDQKRSLRESKDGRPWDVVFGADIVASLYDPVSLAQTIAGLCSTAKTVAYVGFKERLSTIHRQFESEMAAWFRDIEILRPPHNGCRNRNPDVYILTARGKRRNRLEGSAADA
jgi:Lysine methyltransferase